MEAPRRAPWIPFALTLVLAAVGVALYGRPLGPDEPGTFGHWAGAFLVSLSWAGALLSWGMILTALLGLRDLLGWAGPFALGAAGASVVAGALGLAGFIGPEHRVGLACLSAAGPFLLPWVRSARLGPKEPLRAHGSALGWGLLVWAIIAFFVASSLLGGSVPFRGVDEYRYNLLGPRLWSEAGRITRTNLVTTAFQCSSWENLFLWGDAFFAGPRGGGLVAGQLFGRWAHAGIGYLGALLALGALLKPYARNRAWLALAVLAGAADLWLGWTTWQAKNDWGIILWTFAGLAILFAPGVRTPRQTAAAGFLLGLGFTGKFSSVFTIAPALAAWVWRKPARVILACVAGFVVGSLPLLVRNGWLVGDPFFPLAGGLFDSRWAGPRLAWHYREFYGFHGVHPSEWAAKLSLLLRGSPVATLFLLFPFLTLAVKPLRRLWTPWALAMGAAAWFFVAMGPGFEDTIRLLGPAVALIAGTSALVLSELAWSIAEGWIGPAARRTFLAAVGLVMAVALAASPLATSTIPWRAWTGIAKLPDSATLVREVLWGGDAKAWLRANVEPGRLIFTTGEDQFYYASFLTITELTNQPETAWETMAVWDVATLVARLRALGGEYVLDSAHWTGEYRTTVSRRFNRFLLAYPEAIVFVGQASFVVELARLDDVISQACVARPRRPYAPYLGAAPSDRDPTDPLNHYN